MIEASEGWAEQKAALELAKLKSAATTGQGPARLSEKRLIKKREIARIEAEGLTLADFWENDYLHHLKPPSQRIKPSERNWPF